MNELILENAISCLDSDLLEWHLKKKNELRNKRKRKNKIIKLYTALAACFCFMIVAVGSLFLYINDNRTQVHYYKCLGDTQKSDFAEITFTELDRENHICYFTLIKKDNTPFYFAFEGFTNDGEPQHYDVVTPYIMYIPKRGHKVLDVDLIITVNGDIVDSIPRKPGVYEISIDFSEMYNVLDVVLQKVSVSHFLDYDFRTFESIHPDITRPVDSYN